MDDLQRSHISDSNHIKIISCSKMSQKAKMLRMNISTLLSHVGFKISLKSVCLIMFKIFLGDFFKNTVNVTKICRNKNFQKYP